MPAKREAASEAGDTTQGPAVAMIPKPRERAACASSSRAFLALGALSAFVAVASGAFGAHALKARLAPDLLAVFETGARYQMYHALALLAVSRVAADAGRGAGAARAAGWLFVAGTVLFSGSLYALALSGVRALGAVTPFGGVAFLAGWACLAWAALRSGARSAD